MSTAIIITSQNEELLDLCRSFVPRQFPVVVLDGRNDMYGIKAIVQAVETVPHDRIVLLDEDAFIFDAVKFTRLLAWAADDGAACIGMSDGGVVPIRRHNPNVLNPFFNILDLAAIRARWNKDECLSFAGRPIAQELLPPKEMLVSPRGYAFDEFEKYYCFYFWLHATGFRLHWLSAETHIDNVSTLLHDHTGQPFLLHTWYAREFGAKPSQKERITQAAEWAASECNRAACSMSVKPTTGRR
jgi:hypothetical protein